MLKCWGAAVLALSLTACGATPHQAAGGAPAALAAPLGAAYRIDPAQSELRLLVYRAGPLASLGHNHVIVNRSIGGWAAFDGSAASARFELRIPVADFVVDDAVPRREEGADFAEDVADDAKAGTLHNMLSAALLDAEGHPDIVARSLRVTGSNDALTADLRVVVAGRESKLVVPFRLDASAGRLAASGGFRLRQTDLGLTPFRVFLGALSVQDELRVKFTFVAVSGAAGG